MDREQKDLNEVKVSLEEQGNAAKIQLEAAIADQKAQAAKELSEMKLAFAKSQLALCSSRSLVFSVL